MFSSISSPPSCGISTAHSKLQILSFFSDNECSTSTILAGLMFLWDILFLYKSANTSISSLEYLFISDSVKFGGIEALL